EDIVKLTDQAVRIVLQNVDQSDITVALKGANDDVKEVIMRNLSRRVQEMIREELEIMGPAKKKDVEDAQQKIVNIIRNLEENGEIVISRGDGSDVYI
ncbi:MAG TPA: FliG C-terminal domain-containing protein, partial [Bacillota bacterium]|nr:FliG C-terminal domain-containing protein [Bacillota bacterium]